MKAGIDIGYSRTKGVNGNTLVDFASVTGTPEQARISLGADAGKGCMLLSPRHVLVGEMAVEQSRNLQRREDRDWIKSDMYKDLFLAALSGLTAATHVDLTVVTGLPIQFYAGDKEALAEVLTGQHSAQRAEDGRRAQTFTVSQARVIPQGYGALLAMCLDDRGKITVPEVANARVGLIDVGGKTTNLLSVGKLSEIARETASVSAGAWDIARAVRTYLASSYPEIDLRDHELIQAIQNRQIKYFGEPVDLSAAIDEATAPLADEVIASASQLWNGAAGLDMIMVSGGGAHLIHKAIARRFRHARLINVDPVFANAIGYWRFAQRIQPV